MLADIHAYKYIRTYNTSTASPNAAHVSGKDYVDIFPVPKSEILMVGSICTVTVIMYVTVTVIMYVTVTVIMYMTVTVIMYVTVTV